MAKEDNPKVNFFAGGAVPLRGKNARSRLAMPILLLFLFGIRGCDFPSDPQLRPVSIVLNAAVLGDAAFSPGIVHVPLAGQVIWTNDDNVPHSIVGDATEGPCAFESPPFAAEKRFRKAFFERVRCNYYCGLHGRSMRGRIVVE